MITRHRDTGKPKGVFVEFASQVRPGGDRRGLPGVCGHWAAQAAAASRCLRSHLGNAGLPLPSLQDHLAKALTADGEPMLRRPIRVQARGA